MVKVLPDPVTPSSVCDAKPACNPSPAGDSRGLIPCGLKLDCTLKGSGHGIPMVISEQPCIIIQPEPNAAQLGSDADAQLRLTPTLSSLIYARLRNTDSALAQLVEQMTVNHWVAGSSPAGGAKQIKPRTAWFFYFRRSAGREEPSWVRLGFRRAPLDANRTPETYQSRAGGAKYIKPRTAWFFYFRRSAGREEPSWVRLGFR